MHQHTLYSLQQCFFDEDKCIEYLYGAGCFYNTIPCPSCSRDMIANPGRQKFRCPRGDCRKEISIRTGTFFQGSKLKCSKILLMAYLWINKVSMSSIETMTGHSPNTVCQFLAHFRALIASHLHEDASKIGGEGIIVELDESKFGKRKSHRGHQVDGVWIFGGVERTVERRIFLVPVENRNSTTLLDAINGHVFPGSIILTDMWRGYADLAAAGFTHLVVNHSLHFTDPETGVTTNTIEGTWNGVKLTIAPRSRVRLGIEERLLEFIWRRQNANNQWEAFISALRDIHYDIDDE